MNLKNHIAFSFFSVSFAAAFVLIAAVRLIQISISELLLLFVELVGFCESKDLKGLVVPVFLHLSVVFLNLTTEHMFQHMLE